MKSGYVHGYDPREAIRLQDQAATLAELLHSDSIFPKGSHILEAGCGVGAQTITLSPKNPKVFITAIDISKSSLIQARTQTASAGITNVTFTQADIFNLPFRPESFDHVFICFVLEHLPHPIKVLAYLKKALRPGGTITVIEGDHGSTYFYPDSAEAHLAIDCLVKFQAESGGNANIGRQLYPLLNQTGYKNIHVSPRMVYVDSSRPHLVDGFTKKTFTAMIEGVREQVNRTKLIDPAVFETGIADLYRTAEDDGVFCYTFFKATAINN
jgi:ubiquinone/menaquinone biosynthesis C-methylase UbiE